MIQTGSRQHQVISWAISLAVHLLIFLLFGLLAPAFQRAESPPTPFQVQINLAPRPSPDPPERSQPAPSPPAQDRVTPPPPQQPSPRQASQPQEPTLRPITEQPSPTAPSPIPQAESPAKPEPLAETARQAESAPSLASPKRPQFDLSGLDELEVAEAAPSTGVSRQQLRDNMGEIELQGTFSELRTNPPRPYLRQFPNAYGTVLIGFVVNEGLLRIQSIEFLDGSITALPAAEQERLRNELRQWLRAWSLLGASNGSQGKLTVRLVQSGS